MSWIKFAVLGKAQPAGSKRAFQHPHTGKIVVTDAAKGSRSWKQEVAKAAAEVAPDQLLDGPLELMIRFVVARPKGHFGTGRNAGVIKPSAPNYPAVRPDVSKLVRAVEDALTGVLWRDDAQVVRQSAEKRYGEPERVIVTVFPVAAQAAEWELAA